MPSETPIDAIQAGAPPLAESPRLEPERTADAQIGAVTTLLTSLEAPPPPPPVPVILDTTELAVENELVQVRLGIAASLFAALRAKHAPTAHHSLRVALSCSAWSALLGLTDLERDELEVAALLHDIGKIGIADSILLKPAALMPEEYLVVERHRQIGVDILRNCCATSSILKIVQHSGDWFDGSRDGATHRGEDLPLGARIVAIVDAFDAMTSDQVYRRALAQERALAELFQFAGTQFDPRLVQEFCAYVNADPVKLQTVVARYWLKELARDESNALWQRTPTRPSTVAYREGMFYGQLLESMHDAVLFVDSALRILMWNRAAERLTGIAAASIVHKHWSPTLLGMRDDKGQVLDDDVCPVIRAIHSGVQTLRRLSIAGRSGQRLEVDAHLVPVHGKGGAAHGAALLLHDASSQITLEQRIQSLHEKATRDPLTQVANRAEFDRILASYVESHLERRIPCSLILCDLDFFKRVNDTYGHQAGDEVLITFAALLRRHCRSGDLVARYGGEEFVLLCADCDNATATRRAEELRQEVAELPMAVLQGRSVSASFGVTEVQSGDTPETMLRRADRALYQAKSSGRNTVVQLGSGFGDQDAAPKRSSWFSWLLPTRPDQVLQRTLATGVPFHVVVEKMRGFVADHHAQIDSVTENYLVLKVESGQELLRRAADRLVPFVIEMRFDESSSPAQSGAPGKIVRTVIHVTIRPQRGRDRRRRDVLEKAQRLLASLKCYLIAQEHNPKSKSATPLTPTGVEKDRLQAAAKSWTESA